MASLKDNGGTLETRLYVVFNHEDDESSRRCLQHLQNIFNLLHRVPYKPPSTGSSPKVIGSEFENDYMEICRVIHNYSFDIFYYRVTKREGRLSDIRQYIERNPEDLMTGQHQALLVFRKPLLLFLDAVGRIIKLTKAKATKPLSVGFMKILVRFYLYWTHNGLLPKDSADNQITLLDYADAWLAQYYPIGFQLRRWALKIMSFVISANRLFILTQSNRLHGVTQGNFSVQVLSSPATTPYRCPLSIETVQMALDAAVAKTGRIPNGWDDKREWLFERLLGKPKEPFDAKHWKPRVHAELAMIMAMAKGEIKDVLPYVGVSKLSCTMCSHYIGAFNEVWKQNIVIKGSHGKAYAGWFWPSLPDHDEELRQSFLGRVREQLYSDFEKFAGRRLSDSSVGSGGPELEVTGYDRHETLDLVDKAMAELFIT